MHTHTHTTDLEKYRRLRNQIAETSNSDPIYKYSLIPIYILKIQNRHIWLYIHRQFLEGYTET